MSQLISIISFAFICIKTSVGYPLTNGSASMNADESIFISDGNWNNPNNWKDGNLPSSNSIVVIKANALIQTSVTVKELEIEINNSLSIDLLASISIKRHVKINGHVIGDGEIILNGHSAQFIEGTGSLINLRIKNNSTVHFNDRVEIYGNLHIDGGNLLTKNNLFLKCDFETGRTAQVAKTFGQITGDVNVEKCFYARRAYRYISSSLTSETTIRENWQEDAESYNDPVQVGYGTHITGINPSSGPAHLSQDGDNGFDYNPSGNASMFKYNHQNAEFYHIDNTDQNTLESGIPYMLLVRGDRTINIYSNSTPPTPTRLRSKGKLVHGNYFNSDLSTKKNGFSLIGNPYQAKVDMTSVLSKSVNLKTDAYYVWDPTLGGIQDLEQDGGRGAFVVVELPSGTNSSNSDANQYLQPMQAAFVQTKNDGFTQINFSEDDKAITPSQNQKPSDDEGQFLNVKLYNQISFEQGGTASDSFKIKFDNSFTDSSVDDIIKLPNPDENLTRVIGQELVALERRKMPEEQVNLPLYIENYRRENYILKLEFSNDFPVQAYILDHYLDIETVMNSSNSDYHFTVNSSISGSSAEDRFSIKLLPTTLSSDITNLSDVTLTPNPTRDSFQITGLDHLAQADIRIYNLMGQEVYTRSYTNSSSILSVNDLHVSAGVYMVHLNSFDFSKTIKLVIKP